MSNSICFLFSVLRMRTQIAAGCCSVRRIWSPCSTSSHSSSCIHTCWGWANWVSESDHLSVCWLVSLTEKNWHLCFPSGVYEPQACSSQKMMRVFAFASSLIEILALGLQTYNRARYRQLVKRIGHIIRSVCVKDKKLFELLDHQKHWTITMLISHLYFRMTVCYVSDHWAQYVSLSGPAGSSSHSLSLDKLQLEYDHLFLRAVLHVLRNKRWRTDLKYLFILQVVFF